MVGNVYLEMAAYPEAFHLIVALGPSPSARAFLIRDGSVREVTVEVIPGGGAEASEVRGVGDNLQ